MESGKGSGVNENGWPWNEVTCCQASGHGQKKILEWAVNVDVHHGDGLANKLHSMDNLKMSSECMSMG